MRPLPSLDQIGSRVYWRGVAPGAETDWNNPMNWNTQAVPDYSNCVIIPNMEETTGFYPVIDELTMPIGHLNIMKGARVSISKYGTLLIDGFYLFHNGISNSGKLFNYGDLTILNAGKLSIDNKKALFVNCGHITLDNYMDEAVISDEKTVFININTIYTDETLVYLRL